MVKPLRVGLVGSGFMGTCHANAFRSVGGLFEPDCAAVLHTLVDADEATARAAARRLGFAACSSDWRVVVDSPEIDLVDIAAPNALHAPIAIAAAEAGKPVYCEKPLAVTTAEAARMTGAAEAAGTATFVGFNFLRNPLVRLAREMILGGELGEVIAFRGIHAEDYMADPRVPWSWRHEPPGGGAAADIGSHIVSLARYLLGDIDQVAATQRILHKRRPEAEHAERTRAVSVDDRTLALVRFASGVEGTVEAFWAATGRRMQLEFEITGTRGALVFSQERMNELLWYDAWDKRRTAGFRRIETGPQHPPYDRFCPAAGHHLGFNDLKIIEVAEILDALNRGCSGMPDFREAWAVQEVVAAMADSARQGGWVGVAQPQ